MERVYRKTLAYWGGGFVTSDFLSWGHLIFNNVIDLTELSCTMTSFSFFLSFFLFAELLYRLTELI